MIEWCADKITVWLISREAIKEEDRELYVYAAYSFLMSAAPLLLAVLFGSIMDCLLHSILLVIPFMSIRKFSGGYHAERPGSCLIISCLLLVLCIALSSYIRCSIWLAAAVALAIISLAVLSPVDCENRRLDSEEKKRYKIIAAFLALIFGIVCVVSYFLGGDTFAVCISIGLLLAACLQLPCLFQRIRAGQAS